MSDTPRVELTVRSAEKRDAGRGIARLSQTVLRQLRILSGETVVIEGDGQATVAKVWPAGGDVPDDAIQIDGDTRANAGVGIGDAVTIRPRSVEDAVAVTVSPTATLEADVEAVRAALRRELLDRPLSRGDRVRIKRFGVGTFAVIDTDPGGTVRITEDTEIRIPTRTPNRAETSESEDDVGIMYEDIGGLDDQLERIREMVELPLSNPELFRRLGIDPPRGVLLYGPPGTGKTLIAKAVANEVDASFHHVSGPEIMSKYKGESEERLREVFETAREESPAIIFFDEIDSVAAEREDGGDVESRVVAQLLSLMDGLDSRGEVVVIGATNRVDAIDPALRRGGRFDREIEIGVPDRRGRREILEVHTRGMPLADDVDVDRLAERTHGFVGADLESLVTEAAMIALRRARPEDGEPVDVSEIRVTREDLDAALTMVDPSAMREFVAEKPTVGFEAVGGLEHVKETLREAVEWPLSYANLFEATATDPPSGVLLYGPPGTGKTLVARAIAKESGVNFIHVAGPELLDRYVGESEKSVREVFELARQASPTILFFDEIDSIATKRGESHEVTERVVSQLLTELDGVLENPNVVVLAATNRKHAIDPALLRPGRLEEHVEVPEPDAAGRREILRVHTRDKPLAEDVELDRLADGLEGYTGADISALARKASMRAIREAVAEHGIEAANERAGEIRIDRADFEAVREAAPVESD